jgi:ABC-type antimicrobial peptide transport system permease subunit
MNRLDLIRMGLKNLFRRKLRTFLTTLGIIIGTISIVLMVSLGLGMQVNMEKHMSRISNINIITVYPAGGNNHHRRFGGGMSIMESSSKNDNAGSANKKDTIENSDITAFKQIEGVEAVSPIIEHNVSLTSKPLVNDYVNIIGMNLEMLNKYGLKIDQGRMITEEDKNALILGTDLLYDFRNPKKRRDYNWWEDQIDPETGERKPPSFNPLDKNLKLSFDRNHGYSRYDRQQKKEKKAPPTNVSVVGIIPDGRNSYSAYMEINQLMALKVKYDKITAYKDYDGKKPKDTGFEKVYVYVPKRKKIPNIQKELQKLGFQTESDSDWLKERESMNKTIQLVFGAIGGIALLVAAIGITNTMVMAIYERRKEIGVMKVIGSSIRDIKKLFLFESATIGLLGGTLGIIISLTLSSIMNKMQNTALLEFLHIYGSGEENPAIFIIPVWLIVFALLFTSLIGLISGYLPARKAMKLSALEAIKTE